MERAPAGGGYVEANVTLRGAEVQVGQRLGSSWKAAAYAGRSWSGDADAGVRLSRSW